MTRIEEIYKNRKKLFDKVFKPIWLHPCDKDEDVSSVVRNMHLLEISDTLALMYDKMCEKENKDGK